jgi:nitrate reductase alpha subunit
MTWIKDVFDPAERSWEDFYRNRWAYDKVVRSTHGVNCTGGCSWNIYVKQGLVTWELQALDYPRFDPEIPSYEPRGCQRGISFSWYVYSPLRVKYPYVRGVLLDLWRAARRAHPDDPIAAWRSIVSDPETRRSYQQARGKGGLRRAAWDEIHELLAAANLYTVKEHGPDRVVGFSPIPAMSMVSYAAGARFLQLLGGVSLSFYDWYCDLPPASPEIWGEQTDVGESADWYKSRFIAVVGSNVLGTRTPDAHFLVEARHRGTKVVVFSPDFSQTAKVADEWIPLHQGQDGAFWMAVGHVLLKELHVERRVPYFRNYLKKYSDGPFLVELEAREAGRNGAGPRYRPGKMLRASRLAATSEVENAEWKLFVLDEATGELRMPKGTVGHRWQGKKGEWNLRSEDALTAAPYEPALSLDGLATEHVPVEFPDFTEGDGEAIQVRSVPARRVETADGPVLVTTAFELLLAQYGVASTPEAGGDYPAGYSDDAHPFTPAWQERFTGVKASVVVDLARQWGRTAEATEGRCMVVIGAGANHWYHNNLIYRAVITALMVTGCIGKNGGGWNHYVGQEKLVPAASWAPIAFATDWGGPPRLQNAPSFHYVFSDQWRYEKSFREMCPVADEGHPLASGHTIDKQALAVRLGWLPCFPQFDRSSLEVAREARAAGCETPEEIRTWVTRQIASRKLRFAMEDPDAPSCHPRVWYIWRGNALQASAKGHEYFLKHYLGTDHSLLAQEVGRDEVKEVVWHEHVEPGKLDLVVDLNFRMDTSALYSDVVLPAATYYEKDDLNTTDLHSFIHPLQAAVPPCWEAKSDWRIFREIAYHTAELAKRHLPEPVEDVVATPLLHDTPAEIAQAEVLDWAKGECEAIPGKTMPNLTVVERDYANLYQRFISLGPNFRDKPLAVHGTGYRVDDLYDRYRETRPTVSWNGGTYPSLAEDRQVCEVILHFAAETNGELAHRAFAAESEKTGIDHTHLAEGTRGVVYDFDAIVHEPRRVLTSPYWTGITKGGRTYSAFCQNVEELIPWRTLSGRQHLYLDHEAYRAFGEHLPTFKPRPDRRSTRDLDVIGDGAGDGGLVLNYLTPHGKWHIHSTYGDTLRMETLSRGIEPIWLNDRDAGLLGVRDNDWVEVMNDHGAVVTRACVSARIPRGICFLYHATERTIGNPKSSSRGRGARRAGAHNSLTRARLKPLFMIGGYAQFTYAFNYWGPPGVNRDTYVVLKKVEAPTW